MVGTSNPINAVCHICEVSTVIAVVPAVCSASTPEASPADMSPPAPELEAFIVEAMSYPCVVSSVTSAGVGVLPSATHAKYCW